jgi:ABC-type multidrug transport system ATPase subunit
MLAIETRGLTHRFRSEVALRDVCLSVPQGSIYGFLGPNGAGKTTTLRLLLGLLRRQQGSIQVFGLPIERHRVEILRRIGSSIESPSLYAHLTARENLAVWRAIFGCSASRIPEVLRLTGLGETGKKRAGQFSLGMKQRLGIAIALLHQPSLLILDEPTNGLDPHGIAEIRELLLRLNREQGTTIVISSHLLSEVERIITHAAILHRGEVKFQGLIREVPGTLEQAFFHFTKGTP